MGKGCLCEGVLDASCPNPAVSGDGVGESGVVLRDLVY